MSQINLGSWMNPGQPRLGSQATLRRWLRSCVTVFPLLAVAVTACTGSAGRVAPAPTAAPISPAPDGFSLTVSPAVAPAGSVITLSITGKRCCGMYGAGTEIDRSTDGGWTPAYWAATYPDDVVAPMIVWGRNNAARMIGYHGDSIVKLRLPSRIAAGTYRIRKVFMFGRRHAAAATATFTVPA